MTRTRHVCVVTGSRAEFDLLRWTMEEIRSSTRMRLSVVATGMHLSPEFGNTVTELEGAGFPPDDIVETLLSADTSSAVAKSIGLGVIGFADALRRLRPDIVVVLGDRYETFAAAQAAMVLRLVIAHIHGGESAEGVLDESMRHAITKMAHLHFVSTETYRRRVIQLGEQPERVHHVGATGLDRLRRGDILDADGVRDLIALPGDGPLLVVTHHPVTAVDQDPESELQEVIEAVASVPEARIVFTLSNADALGRAFNARIRAFAESRPDGVRVFESLGQRRYLGLVAAADAVVGNSSSGIIEAPSVGTPTVNVGPRQRGRVKPASVVDCEPLREDIVRALRQALDSDFRDSAFSQPSPYDLGGAAERIAEHLATAPLDGITMKAFYDLPAP